MKLLALSLMFISLPSLACWKMQGTLDVNGTKVEIDQKIDHDKTYSFQSKNLLFHVKIPSQFETPSHVKDKKSVHLVEINVEEKKGVSLTEVAHGKILTKTGTEATMTSMDNKTGESSTFIVKLTEI